MLKNWSRVALASFLVLMVGASVASATTARVRSLANVGDYISDDSAVNRWYSTLTSFGNQVNAEMGQWNGFTLADTRGLGWTQACGENGKYGTYRISLNENDLSDPGFWIGNPFYRDHNSGNKGGLADPTPGAYNDMPVNQWDVAGAWELSKAVALGVSITQSKWSVEDTANQIKGSNSFTGLGAGITWSSGGKVVVDGVFNYGFAGGDIKEGANSVKWDSKTAIDVAGRMFYDWKDNVTVVPTVEYTTSSFSLSTSPTALPNPNGDKLTDFMIGVGLNMDVNQDNMLVAAIEWMHRKYEYVNPDTASAGFASTTLQYLPTIRLALESHITSWLTTRVGAAKYLVTQTDETNGGDKFKLSQGSPAFIFDATAPTGFDWFLGCGFNVAEWTVDLELNSEAPFALGYWLTGYSYPTAQGPVARISAVYNY